MTTPNPKCSRCRCYWKPTETDIKSSGLYFTTCKKCRDKDFERKEKNKEQKQKYREQNREELRDKAKEYKKVNRDKILARNKELVVCECGITTTRNYLTEHKKSEKHKIFLEFKTKTDDDISKDLLTHYHRCELCKVPINNKEWSLKHHYLKEHNKRFSHFDNGKVFIYGSSNEVND